MITCKRWLKIARRLGRWQPKYHADVDWYNNKYLNDAKKKKRKDKWKVNLKKAHIMYDDFWQEIFEMQNAIKINANSFDNVVRQKVGKHQMKWTY